jgi:hypothetical protein
VYQVQREKQLKSELERAKQEYMDVLGNGMKRAEELDSLFPSFGGEKTAQDSSFGVISYPMAAAAILTILGAGGTGYLTKKILDSKVEEAEETGRDIPKVKRIVFRTQQPNEAAPPLPAAEAGAVKAAFALMLDYVGGRTDYVGATDVAAAIKKAGTTADELLTKVATDAQDTVGFLKQHPQLVDSITGKLFNDNRLKKFVAQTAPGRAYAIHRVGKLVNRLSPPAVKAGQASGAGGGSGGVGGNPTASPKHVPLCKRVRLTPPWMKSSQELPIGTLAGKALGSLIKKEEPQPTGQDIAKDMVAQQHHEDTNRMLSKLKVPDTVQFEAQDPLAAKFLNANQRRIVRLVKQLAKEGTL